MWRALFLAIGGTLLVVGIESLLLDHAVLSPDSGLVKPTVAQTAYDDWGFEVETKSRVPTTKTISPPEWAPWSMLSSGAVMLFYGLASRIRGSGE